MPDLSDTSPPSAGKPDGGKGPGGEADGAALIQALGRPFSAVTLRSAPVQPRAVKTVERILAAGRSLGLSLGRPPALQAVAESAGVTLSAAYRYFSTPEDLVRTLVRMAALRHFARFRSRLAGLTLASAPELAQMMARSIIDLIRNEVDEPGVPRRLRVMLIRDYHRIAYEDLWNLAGDVRAAMRRNGLGAEDPDLQSRIALAFGAAAGLLAMRLAQTGPLRDEASVATALEAIFLHALRDQA